MEKARRCLVWAFSWPARSASTGFLPGWKLREDKDEGYSQPRLSLDLELPSPPETLARRWAPSQGQAPRLSSKIKSGWVIPQVQKHGPQVRTHRKQGLIKGERHGEGETDFPHRRIANDACRYPALKQVEHNSALSLRLCDAHTISFQRGQ